MAVEDMLSDIRREAVEHTLVTRSDVKDSRFDIASRIAAGNESLSKQVDAIDDTLSAAINTVSRDTMDLRAQVTAVGYQVRDGFVAAAKDAEINALKTQVEMAKQTTYLSDKIDAGNSKTQELVNALRAADQDRMLIERNADLVGERYHSLHWRHGYDNAQWNSLQSNLNAFQSQLQETRQGMVNFGTMAGVGQTSTSNNVR